MVKDRSTNKKSPAVPTLGHYGADCFDKEKSPTSEERPKRMTFTELAEELTRRSNLE